MAKKSDSSAGLGGSGTAKSPRTIQPKAAVAVKKRPAPKAMAASAAGESSVTFTNNDPEEIARLAYSYWKERGGQGGSPEDDWLRAEQELRQRNSC